MEYCHGQEKLKNPVPQPRPPLAEYLTYEFVVKVLALRRSRHNSYIKQWHQAQGFVSDGDDNDDDKDE